MTQNPYDRPLVRGTTHVVMVVLLIAGPLISIRFARSALHAFSATKWPRAPAVITRSELVTTDEGLHQRVEAVVEYDYEVGGRTYAGNKLHPSHTASSDDWTWHHQQLVDRFPVNTRAEAFYSPQDPAEAYLLTNFRWVDVVPIFAPWIFVTFAVAWFIDAWRRSTGNILPAEISSIPPNK